MLAGQVAFDEGIHRHDLQRFRQSIAHFADALILTASRTGYNVVMLRGLLKELQAKFKELRTLAQQNREYINVLQDWCDTLDHAVRIALTTTTDEEDRRFNQGEHFVQAERSLLDLMTHYDLRLYVWPRVPTTAEIDAAVEFLVHPDISDYTIEQALDVFEALLYAPNQMPNQIYSRLLELYNQFEPESADITEPPARWQFASRDWLTFSTLVYACASYTGNLPRNSLPNYVELVATLYYQPGIRASSKYHLAHALSEDGYSNAKQTLLEQVIAEARYDGNLHLHLIALNEIARILAQHGDYLSAVVYSEGLDEIFQALTDKTMQFHILMTRGWVYRSWGRNATTRGAAGLIGEIYSRSIDSFRAAGDMDAARRLEAELEIAVTRGYWYTAQSASKYEGSEQSYVNHLEQIEEVQQSRDAMLEHLEPTSLDYANLELSYAYMLLHKMPRVSKYDISLQKLYYPQIERALRNTAQIGAQTHRYRLEIAALTGLLELKYLGLLEHPDRERVQALSAEVPGGDVYRYLLQECPIMREVQRLRRDIQHENEQISQLYSSESRILNIDLHDPRYLPEAYRHYFGRVELIAGATAQWSGHIQDSVQHYVAAGNSIVHSVYSVFNVDILVSFLTSRFEELGHSDHLAVAEWAQILKRKWETDAAIRSYYSDLLDLCDIQYQLAVLNAEVRQRKN